ncbi:MlaD family protein [Bosea sp. (in: a-proteobacteria)]|uniref:MlaD family protein n=1 Tax=Bosea sp. (in: a-proteobacteria) TaxID=1871050 RepID=UPI002735FB4D|nr:MlaD family protein [Bosea sp. (in: a-proteobacteria)]MDP3408502.1 MlaD family protein [Bosea sp. (in: a-proteobacteria)]
MQSRASHALVGLFTLAVLAALFGFVYWFSSGGGARKMDVRLIFNDKITGLGRGSSVLFNGLRVGEVTRLALHPGDPRQIYAVITVDRSTPLRVDTRARIEAQGLAGVVAVQLLGGAPDAAVLKAEPGQSLATITAEPTEGFLETVRTVAKRAEEALGGIEAMVKENETAIGDRIRSAEQFSIALSGNADGIASLMQNIGGVADVIAPVTQKLGTFSEDITQTIRSLDRAAIASAVASAGTLTATLGDASGAVSQGLKDVGSITGRLNRAADQVDGVLKGAQAFLNTAAGQNGRNAFSDASEAARNIRVLADTLDRSSADITAEIVRLTRGGLRGLEPFIDTGRRALTGFGRTLQGIEQDPQQLIFSTKPTVPPFGGSR